MSSFEDFEAVIDKAIDGGIIPGAVVVAKDKSGKLDYAYSAGQASSSPAPQKPIALDTIFALASMTKLITTIALLQVVERGQLSLEEDVAPYVPTLAHQPVISSPSASSESTTSTVTTVRKDPITLRHLLTHTSGISYPFLNPTLGELKAKVTGSPDPFFGSTVAERYGLPLLFEPGTQWQYGASIDWAGQVLEAVTGVDLETWVQQHILSPLNISRESMTFFPAKIPGLIDSDRFARVSVRNKSSMRVEFATGEGETNLKSETAFGGEGLYADMTAFAEVLHSLLIDDGRLLSAEMTAKMFTPNITTAEAKVSLLKQLETPDWIVGVVPPTGEYDWGLGGLLVDGDSHPYRRRGALFWSGMFNLIWFIDREAGVCGVFGTQVLPTADPLIRPIHEKFEEEVYKHVQVLEHSEDDLPTTLPI